MNLPDLAADPFIHAVGWTLLHFLWQGALVAGLLAGFLALADPRDSGLRYAVSCAALLLMLALPVLTFCAMDAERLAGPAARLSWPPPPAAAVDGAEHASATAWEAEGWTERARRAVSGPLPWLVLLWGAGVFGLSVRLLGGWWLAHRLRARGAAPAGAEWEERLRLLAGRMGVGRTVQLLVSARAHAPLVIGWLKPVILMPVAALAGLTPAQAESILAHELAHIRRHDYLVNLVQAAIETLLFYHPAVWWVSARIRDEREHCCDDAAVAACGDVVLYASTLADLAERRLFAPSFALGVTDGSLLARIRRLVDAQARLRGGTTRFAAGLVLLVILAALLAGARRPDRVRQLFAQAGVDLHPSPRELDLERSLEIELDTLVLLPALELEMEALAAAEAGALMEKIELLELERLRSSSQPSELRAMQELLSETQAQLAQAQAGMARVRERTPAPEHGEQAVRAEAVRQIARMRDAGARREAVPVLAELAREKSAVVGEAAVEALRELGTAEAVRALEAVAGSHAAPERRLSAIRALGDLGTSEAAAALMRLARPE